MFDRFTDRARKVMNLGRQEAQRLHHEYIGTEHILLGLVLEGSGVAANVLRSLEVDLDQVRVEVEKMVPTGEAGAAAPTPQLPFTPRSKRVLELAFEEAGTLGHNYIGTEHLLLGLLRESDSVASKVLKNLGLKLGEVRQEVMEQLEAGMPPGGPGGPGGHPGPGGPGGPAGEPGMERGPGTGDGCPGAVPGAAPGSPPSGAARFLPPSRESRG